jgi:hypothetical protein
MHWQREQQTFAACVYLPEGASDVRKQAGGCSAVSDALASVTISTRVHLPLQVLPAYYFNFARMETRCTAASRHPYPCSAQPIRCLSAPAPLAVFVIAGGICRATDHARSVQAGRTVQLQASRRQHAVATVRQGSFVLRAPSTQHCVSPGRTAWQVLPITACAEQDCMAPLTGLLPQRALDHAPLEGMGETRA